jgi:hypothetical protein
VSDQSGLGTDRLKHLELIQAVVSRLGTSSFLIKGWTLTIAAALFALLATRLSWQIALVGVIPVTAFWFLDALFLRNERLFRRLYDDARRTGTTVEPMSMDITPYRATTTWWSAMFSDTLALFYGALLLVDLALVVVAAVVKH